MSKLMLNHSVKCTSCFSNPKENSPYRKEFRILLTLCIVFSFLPKTMHIIV